MLSTRSAARLMMPAFAVAGVAALAPATASAQVSGLGYAFGAPGAAVCCGDSESTLHVGGGGEALIANTVGIGAELGYLAPFSYVSEGVGVMSVNGSYHFIPTGGVRRVSPFVTGGYSRFFRQGHINLWNVGGGVDYWMKPNVGLRLELRDHISRDDGSYRVDSYHFLSPRIGVVFRRK